MSDEPTKPERLWKYRKWDEYARRMVVDGEVHYTRLEKLNDPFDASWCMRLPKDEAELDEFARALCAMTFPDDLPDERLFHFTNMKQSVRALVNEYGGNIIPSFVEFKHGLLCLSAIEHDILMWSHYADHHRGVCIGIRTECLTRKRILKVRYEDQVPLLDCWDYIHRNRELFVNATRTKGLHWDYEEEWRTVHYSGPFTYPNCVDRVVIGCRATDKTKADVFEAVAGANRPIEVCQAKVNSRRYRLEFESVATRA
jgi:hypothetical protein